MMSSSSILVFMTFWVITSLVTFVKVVICIDVGNSDHQHVYTDSFPRNDEYDTMALDPSTPYGTPYGGFSRAVSSRLASLPLTLPSIGKEIEGESSSSSSSSSSDDDFEPMYTTVRDNFGRPFVCRTYHEDELEPDSLGDSMFDTPRLRKKKSSSVSETTTSDTAADEINKNDNDDAEAAAATADLNSDAGSDGDGDGGGDDDDDNASTTHTASTITENDESIERHLTDSNNNEDDDENVNVDDEDSEVVVAGDDDSIVKAERKNERLKKTPASELNPVMLGHEIHQRLSKLVGLCAQLHPGWWSYEFCYQEKVTQFHVSIKTKIKGDGSGTKVQDFSLEDVTNLGSYSGRSIELTSSPSSPDKEKNKDDNDDHATQPIDLAQERKELGRVVDTFIGGDVCPETDEPRVTEATFRCCSQHYLSKTMGGILKNGRPVETDVVTIFEATESKDAVCRYNIILCTPLLCDDYIPVEEDDGGNADDYFSTTKSRSKNYLDKAKKKFANKKKKSVNLDLDPDEAKNMSVVEILEKTFGTDGDFCIRTATSGWWQYEVCPGKHVRQYHESDIEMLERITGAKGESKKSKDDENEHFLGRFNRDEHDAVTKENEWKHVVNATTAKSDESGKYGGLKSFINKKRHTGSTKAGGNGSYYYQEYTKGDVCDHEDVTDSAIKAGEFGEGGIERATTVRYSCTDKGEIDISVKEDSTCHYIVEISVPTLCYHPLFKAPVSKRQVMKCLPLRSS